MLRMGCTVRASNKLRGAVAGSCGNAWTRDMMWIVYTRKRCLRVVTGIFDTSGCGRSKSWRAVFRVGCDPHYECMVATGL